MCLVKKVTKEYTLYSIPSFVFYEKKKRNNKIMFAYMYKLSNI